MRTHARRIARARRTRAGFSLVEVMLAIVLLSVAVTGLAGMTMWAGRRSAIAAMQENRLAITASLIDKLSVLPFDSLDVRAGCTTVTAKPFPHDQCIVVAAPTPSERHVTIVIVPASPLLRADSVSFDRTAAPPPLPFS